MKKPPSNLVKSIDRAIDILEELARADKGLGVTELGNKLNIHKSSVHRLLSTLIYKGLVKQDEKRGNYKLGLKIFELGSRIFNDLKIRDYTKPYLEELVKASDERVNLVIPDQKEIIYIDKLEGSKSVKINLPIGKRVPIHCTAAGKAILAYASPKKVENIIKTGLPKFTDNTIIDPQSFIEELDLTKKRGYAIDNAEYKLEFRCIAVPIFDYNDEVIAAVSISGPTIRLTQEKISNLIKLILTTGKKISQQLGSRFDQVVKY